jgi:hypothetical protein
MVNPMTLKIPPEQEILALVGHQFPSGQYCVEFWENFLLTGCTGAEILVDGIVHPVALFHLPIVGAGTSIADMFALGQAQSDLSISIESYDWEMFAPIEEDLHYEVSGKVTAAERRYADSGMLHPPNTVYDRIQFCFDVSHPDGSEVARTTITWYYWRPEQ